ncbi:MAG: M23 family metallopeptidase [Prevotellaceae bacterium]|nr:M23 family metallopeptidase [Candidatus Colivivens equi]
MSIRRILLGIITTSLVAVSAYGQDLMARRAPSDNHMLDVKNIKITNTFVTKKHNAVEANIYTSWDNSAVSKVSGFLPAGFKVDLREFCMPTPSRQITSNYGRRWGKMHRGIDLKVYIGDTILAAFDGKVRVVKYDPSGWGYYVLIRHANGLETLYGHLSRQLVYENQDVKAGQPIGLGGNTGRSTGSHLHFETRLLGETINPAFMFDFVHQDVTGDFYISTLGEINKQPTFPIDYNNVQSSPAAYRLSSLGQNK